MPNNPPANPIPGAIYVDQLTNLTWIWTGTYWVQASGASGYNTQVGPGATIAPGFYAEPSPDSWIPHVGPSAPLSPSCGQIWIDTSVTPNSSYVWDCNSNSHILLAGGDPSASSAIVATVAPITRTNGNPLEVGDLWVDATTQVISYWNGSSWLSASSPDTNSIPSAVEPTARADGSALQAGDVWADLNSNLFYFYNGTSFVTVVAQSDDHQLASSAPTVSPSGATLSNGDRWTDSSTGNAYYYESGVWVAYNDTHSQASTVQPTTRETGGALRDGDQWFDTNLNLLYVYKASTSTWYRASGDTHSFVQSGQPTLVLRPNGDTLAIGDQYIDDATNKLWYWTGTVWSIASNDTHSFTGNGIPALATRPDGTALVSGDLYLDLVGNDLYGYNGSGWVPFISPNTHAFTGSGTPTLTLRPDGSPLLAGDEYIDITTDIGYYWNGTSWEFLSRDLHSFTGLVAPTIIQRPDGNPLIEGDQYINKTTGDTYYWDSAAWIPLGGDTHSIRATTAPTTRANGTPLRDGDQWVDTDNQNAFYVYNLGTSLWEILGDDTHCFAGAGGPTLTLRPNGQPLQVGDQWLDTSTYSLYGYDGAVWNRVGSDLHSFYGAADPALTVRPDGTTLLVGDQFLNSTTKILFAWDGAAWNVISGDTHSMLGAGDPVTNNPTITRPNGSPLKDGDQYIDTVTNEAYYYNAGIASWNMFSSQDTHSFTGSGFPALTVRPNGEPLLAGDQYVDLNSDHNVLYVWDGTQWEILSKDTHSYRGTGAPTLTARPNGTPLIDGDMWVDQDGRKIYVYDAVSAVPGWVLVSHDTHSWADAGDPNTSNPQTTRLDGSILEVGDQYVDSNYDILYYWNGAIWDILSSYSHSFVGNGVPTLATRPDGTPLISGDQYVDETTDILYYYDSALSWVVLGGASSEIIRAAAAPTARLNTFPLRLGDQWVDTDNNNVIYSWNGTAWEKSSDDTHTIWSAIAPTLNNDGLPLKDGDLWANSSMDTYSFHDLKVYHGGVWHDIGTADTHSFTGNGTPYISAPSVGTNTQTLRPDGGALVEGDFYWDKNDNVIYAYNSAEWIPVADDYHALDLGTMTLAYPSTPTTRPDGTALRLADQATSKDRRLFTWTEDAGGVGVPGWRQAIGYYRMSMYGTTLDPNTNALYNTRSSVDGTTQGTLQGDMYVDSQSLGLWVTDGAGNWEKVNDDTHSFSGSGAPALTKRPANDAGFQNDLVAGDQYIDTTADSLYYWDGAAWQLISSTDTHSFTGTVDPTITVRPDGSALLTGDQYINTTTDVLFYYNGTAWEAFTNTIDTHSFTGAGVPTLTQRPDTTVLLVGDQYLDTNTKVLYSWNGTTWDVISDDTHSIYGSGDPIVSNPVTTRPNGSALQQGDVYSNGDDNTIWVYSGASWNMFSTYVMSYTAIGAPTLTQRPTGESLVSGDQYIDSSTNTLYYWNGTAWTLLSSTDTHSFSGTADPTLTVRPDGTALLTGDQFINTTADTLWYYNGTAWEKISSADTHSFTGSGAPTLTVRPDASALLSGDTYTDIGQLPIVVQYVYDSGIWNLDDDFHVYLGGSHPSTSTYAASTNGKMYTNIFTRDFYCWVGSAWVLIGPTELQKDSVATNGFPTTRANAVDTQLNGDIFEDTDTSRRFYWDTAAAAYVPMGGHNFVQNTIPATLLTYERDIWIDTTTMEQFVYYNDGSTTQWTQVN